MVFHVARPVRNKPAILPQSKEELACQIEQNYRQLRNKYGPLTTDQLFWLYGPKRNEPLPYGYRLNVPPPLPVSPFQDASLAIATATAPVKVNGRDSPQRPISAITRADMPPRFRQWFLQDDIIFFRTRSAPYLMLISKSRQMEAGVRTKFESKIWEPLRAYMDMEEEACPGCSSSSSSSSSPSSQMDFLKKCALLLMFLLIRLRFKPGAFISTLPKEPIIYTANAQGGGATNIIVQVITACIRLVVLVAFTSLQLWFIWGMVFSWVPLLLSLGRGYLRYRDVLNNPVDRVCVSNFFSADRKYHTWEREISQCVTDGKSNHHRNHHPNCENESKTKDYGTSTSARRSCAEEQQQGLLQSLRALASFWAFYRRTTNTTRTTGGGGDGWYRPVQQQQQHQTQTETDNETRQLDNRTKKAAKKKRKYQGNNNQSEEKEEYGSTSSQNNHTESEPIIRRLELMERGDLVVCLTPYPDLVTVSWLAWMNNLYQSYRAWQRWLLAQRVYRLLELDPREGPLRLGKVMFRSVSGLERQLQGQVRQRQRQRQTASGYGDKGEEEEDLEGEAAGNYYSLVVEMATDNNLQTGKWLL